MAKFDSNEIFERLPILKSIRIMAVPTIFSQIVVLIYNLADTFLSAGRIIRIWLQELH